MLDGSAVNYLVKTSFCCIDFSEHVLHRGDSIAGLQDGSPDDDVVRAGGERTAKRIYTFLIVAGCSNRPDTRCDAKKALAFDRGAYRCELVRRCYYAIQSAFVRQRGKGRYTSFNIAGAAYLSESTGVRAG